MYTNLISIHYRAWDIVALFIHITSDFDLFLHFSMAYTHLIWILPGLDLTDFENAVHAQNKCCTKWCYNLVSDVYWGNAAGKAITKDCGILEQLDSGDMILADKGFTIRGTGCYSQYSSISQTWNIYTGGSVNNKQNFTGHDPC